MANGVLYGVSVGPGDPELITFKAVRIIREADVIAVPQSCEPSSGDTPPRSMALAIAGDLAQDKHVLYCPAPMTRDQDVLEAAHRQSADLICQELDKGQVVAYLCLGDVGIYSSYAYIHTLVRLRGYEASMVSGVTSFSAAAACLGMALCMGSERLTIADASTDNLDEVLDASGTKVLMKAGRSLRELKEHLEARGLLDRARMVCNCGLPNERIYEGLRTVDAASYFSIVIIPGE